MFNKKQESGFGIPSGGILSSLSNPPPPYANTAEANYSIINEFLTMKGDLDSEADILVQGKVIGNISCKMLIVDTNAHVEGGIIADDVIVRGTTKGVLKATRVRFEKTAQVESEIWQQTFSVEEGAKITGALHHSENPTSAAAKTSNITQFSVSGGSDQTAAE